LGPGGCLSGYEKQQQQAFDSVEIGMDKSTILKKMGSPSREGDSFNPERYGGSGAFLDREVGFDFQLMRHQGVHSYIEWINGINWFYCIGFDKNGKVVIKGEGHS